MNELIIPAKNYLKLMLNPNLQIIDHLLWKQPEGGDYRNHVVAFVMSIYITEGRSKSAFR